MEFTRITINEATDTHVASFWGLHLIKKASGESLVIKGGFDFELDSEYSPYDQFCVLLSGEEVTGEVENEMASNRMEDTPLIDEIDALLDSDIINVLYDELVIPLGWGAAIEDKEAMMRRYHELVLEKEAMQDRPSYLFLMESPAGKRRWEWSYTTDCCHAHDDDLVATCLVRPGASVGAVGVLWLTGHTVAEVIRGNFRA